MNTLETQTQQYLKDVEDGKETLASLKVLREHNEKITWFMEALANAKTPTELELKADFDGLCAAIEILEDEETANP